MSTLNEQEAALLEGIAPMPKDLIPLRDEKKLLDEQIDKLISRKKDITDMFGDRLEADGLQGYVLHGKVHARVTQATSTRVDSKRLKVDMPHIHSEYLVVTKSRRVTVN